MRLALIVVAVGILAPAAISASHPQVRLSGLSPTIVRGSAFKPSERVTVTLSYGKTKAVKAVRASRSGAFTLRFSTQPPACSKLGITARGSLGSTAAWKAPPPECGTEPGPLGS
jgi:hypothetical protein